MLHTGAAASRTSPARCSSIRRESISSTYPTKASHSPAVIAGEVQLTFAGIATAMAPLRAGRIKALAIGGDKRSPLLPDVPTFAELGFPEVQTHAWFGFFLPAGVPAERVSRLCGDTKQILVEPAYREKLIERGYDIAGSSPPEFAAYIKKDLANRGRAVEISGAKAE